VSAETWAQRDAAAQPVAYLALGERTHGVLVSRPERTLCGIPTGLDDPAALRRSRPRRAERCRRCAPMAARVLRCIERAAGWLGRAKRPQVNIRSIMSGWAASPLLRAAS